METAQTGVVKGRRRQKMLAADAKKFRRMEK